MRALPHPMLNITVRVSDVVLEVTVGHQHGTSAKRMNSPNEF